MLVSVLFFLAMGLVVGFVFLHKYLKDVFSQIDIPMHAEDVF